MPDQEFKNDDQSLATLISEFRSFRDREFAQYQKQDRDDKNSIRQDIKDLGTNTLNRVESLERWRAWMAGGIGILALIIIPLAAVILQHLAADSGNQAIIKQIQDDHIQFKQDLQKVLTK